MRLAGRVLSFPVGSSVCAGAVLYGFGRRTGGNCGDSARSLMEWEFVIRWIGARSSALLFITVLP